MTDIRELSQSIHEAVLMDPIILKLKKEISRVQMCGSLVIEIKDGHVNHKSVYENLIQKLWEEVEHRTQVIIKSMEATYENSIR